MRDDAVIGAFSEEQAARISGLSTFQLRQWDREGFFQASLRAQGSHIPYGRLYSFRDLVALQVLDDLRNRKGIPLQHLREVSQELAHLGDQRWTATTLYVLGKRVVLEHPETRLREEVVSKQQVLNIPLRVVIRNTRERIREISDRNSKLGQFSRARFVAGGEEVLAGTRIPVSTIRDYLRAGATSQAIKREFPVLQDQDIEAVRKQEAQRAA